MMTSQRNSATNDRMQDRALKIYFDGGCRPNPGNMETAVVVRGNIYHRFDCGQGNSNDAEWLALIHATEVALQIGHRDVLLLGDSAVVVGQANGAVKCRSDALRQHLQMFAAIRPQFERIRIRKIGRHQNLAGIALAKSRI